MSTAQNTNETGAASNDQPAVNGTPVAADVGTESTQQSQEEAAEIPPEEVPYNLTIKAPNGTVVPIVATSQETIQDLKQAIGETPSTIEYSCFYLALNDQRLNDFAELGEIEELPKEAELTMHEDRYTERDARAHVSRLRDLLAGPSTANSTIAGLDAGASIFSTVKHPDGAVDEPDAELLSGSANSADDAASSDAAPAESGGEKKTKGKGKGKNKSKEASAEASANESAAEKIAPLVKDHAFKGYQIGSVPPFSVISSAEAISALGVPQCVKQLILSGWNPVPRYRQLQGDLLYLLVTTLENQTYHITASRDGFYVNSSSLVRFNPEVFSDARNGQANGQSARDSDHYRAHSLVTLLKRLSPRFARALDEVQREMARREPVEVVPFVSASQAATPWLACGSTNRVPSSYDLGRAQETFLQAGSQGGESLRDWNEELQSIREMARGNLSERVVRDRQLHKWHAEFAESAVQGAMAVVDGEMAALNPLDPSDQHMFLRDNIFYSKGFDGRETFAELGGDAAAHVATGKDITGVRLLNQLDIEGLHTLGSVVVDYRGVRVVAQSVVPGIFRRQETTQIVYGSVDNGKTLSADEEFHKLLAPVAKALHFGEHVVADAEGAEYRLYTSADVKGLTGTDGRKYMLDLYRMSPVDVGFLEKECCEQGEGAGAAYPHKLVLLRPELMDIFWENRLMDIFWENRVRKAVQEYAAAKAGEAEKTEAGEKAEADEKTEEGQKTEEDATKDSEEEEKPAKDDEQKPPMADFEFSLDFSPDAFTPIQARSSSASEEPLAAAVRSASQFLRDVSVPAFARELATYTTSPLSGDALVVAMHQRGINMRYLGLIASLLPDDSEVVRNVRRLVVFEMIARASKHIVRRLLRATPAHLHGEAFALVVNALLGTRRNETPSDDLSEAARRVDVLAQLTPARLAADIQAEVALRFRFALADDFVAAMVHGNERILLREISQRVGVQLAMKQYYFEQPAASQVQAEAQAEVAAELGNVASSKAAKRLVRERVDIVAARRTVVRADDVLNFVARTKVSTHNSTFADEAFEAGRMSLEQGQRQMGLELLLESLALHEQTFGFLHAESARCYAVVSLAHYDAGEQALAAEFMTKAVVISERTVGLDNPLTIHNYLNLALYEHARGNTLVGLRLMRHALDLWNLVNSADHPDLATAHNNVGVMLQSLRLFDDALEFVRSAYEIRLRLHGARHVLVAGAQHAMAKALALTGDFKAAVQAEREAHGYFSETFGPEDARSKETGEWLAELTFNAVRTAKLTRAAREKMAEAAAKAGGLMPVADAAGAAAAAQQEEGAKGLLPIDELLKFITGNGNRADKPRPSGGKRSKHAPKGSRR
ncbi:Intracellular distribution of mitochondria [Coemansia interrupta]|uniref:Intracellular distribution of mitochondria n=1 Tax=Coemansia interrupta TaxID=1126814 RepID=A0A9W8HCY5_9FUNG|nr:Intracellular distribution of mitochondria [Coemansia interrupta]